MWKDLTLKEKAEIMKMSVANGVTDINDIQKLYNSSIGISGHLFKDGGRPDWSHDPASMIEHFEGFRESPYRDGTAWSVGYGQYMKGYGASLDWDALLSGRKKLTRSEAHQQVLRTVEDLKRQLRKTLGDKLYNSLTPGQLMGYLDTGYQRPASMIEAARIHRQRGAEAAASVLGVRGYADRNSARRAAFTGNWNNYTPKGGTRDYMPSSSSGDAYRRQMLNNYTSPAFQPVAETNTPQVSPWNDYLASLNRQLNFTPSAPNTLNQSSYAKLGTTFSPVNFANISQSPELLSSVQPSVAKQEIEYGLGLNGNALWNSPYLMFDHYAANGGHLYGDGSMLLTNNQINPALQYVYGPDYENIIRQRNSYRPIVPLARSKPKYNITQQADAVQNTVRPAQKRIREKQTVESPARRDKEQREADAAKLEYRKARQGTIGPAPDRVRHPDYDPVKAQEVQLLREKEAKENQDAYARRVVEHNILEGMEAIPWPSTIVGSLLNPNTHWYEPGSLFTNLYANDNRGFFNFNQTTRDWYDENPEVGTIANLVGDIVVPGAAAKALSTTNKIRKGYELSRAMNKTLDGYKGLKLNPPSVSTLQLPEIELPEKLVRILDDINYYSSLTGKMFTHPKTVYRELRYRPRKTTVNEIMNTNNLPPKTMLGDWDGDWLALQTQRAENGGLSRLQAVYDEGFEKIQQNQRIYRDIKDKVRSREQELLNELNAKYKITDDSDIWNLSFEQRQQYFKELHPIWEEAAKYERELFNESDYVVGSQYAPNWIDNNNDYRYIVPTIEEIKNYTVNLGRNQIPGSDLWAHTYTGLHNPEGTNYLKTKPIINIPATVQNNRLNYLMEVAHEVEHDIVPFLPEEALESMHDWLDFSKFTSSTGDYMSGGIEPSARGSQIKNWFGLREGDKLTGNMIRHAKKNYVKTTKKRGLLDNNMTEFLNAIKDPDKAAAWFNKYSLGITGVTGLATAGTTQLKKK